MTLSIPQSYIGRTGLLIYLRMHTEKWARKLRGANEDQVQAVSRA